MVSSSSLLPSRSRSKDGGVRLQQQRQRHRASGLREGPTRRARLLPRPRRLGGLPRAGGTLSEEEEEEQELLLSEEVFERKGCMLLLVSTPTQRPRPDDSAFHFVHQSSADSSKAALCTVSSLSRQDSASCFAFRVKKKGKREGRERERERDDWSSKIWGKTLTVAPVLASRVGCCCSGDHAPRAAVRALVSCERFRPRRSADAAGKHHHRPGVFEERKRERARALMIDDASEVFSFFSSSPRKTVSEESALPPVFDRSTSPASSSRFFFFFPITARNSFRFVALRLVFSRPTAARTMGVPHGEGGGGESASQSNGELVLSSSPPSSPSSSIASSSSRPRLALPSLPPHLRFSLPSPRGIASAVAGTGDAARHQAHLALRTADFWRRATGIYLAYKGRQAQEAALTSRALALLPGSSSRRPWDRERLEEELWKPHHEWAGKEMYELAVSVRGFYLKVSGFEEVERSRGREVERESSEETEGREEELELRTFKLLFSLENLKKNTTAPSPRSASSSPRAPSSFRSRSASASRCCTTASPRCRRRWP